MSSHEEYEHFSESFNEFWNKSKNTDLISKNQNEYDKKLEETIRRNLASLEKCIEKNTMDLITNVPYDITFDCKNLVTLPPYTKIDQGFGDIGKPYVPDQFRNLKYLHKPLRNIGITPKWLTDMKLQKNTFEIIHKGSDFDWENSATSYIIIRISNTEIEKIE